VAPPAKYSRNDTIREYFFYAKNPDFLGFFAFWSFGGLLKSRSFQLGILLDKKICTHLGVTRGSMGETRESIMISI